MYSVGFDVSKGKSTVAIISIEGEVITKPFEIEHTKSGFQIIENQIKNHPKENIKFIMESTGNYHLPLLNLILEKNYFVCVENAFKIKKYCDLNIRKAKTDKKDALKIACYGSEKWHSLKQYNQFDEVYEELRFLSRQYSQQIDQKVKARVQLSNLIDLTFPNLNNIISNDNCFMFLLEVYEKYPHPDLVLSKNKTSFLNDVEKMAKKLGHRIGRILAERVYTLALEIIPSRPYNKSTQLAVTNCVSLLRHLEETTTSIITKMDELASTLPEFEVVSKMQGVGKKIRSRLIAEIGNVKRFKSGSSLIAYAGIDTPPYESGQFKATHIHISKRGNKYLRKVGYETMKSLKTVRPNTDNSVYLYMLKKESEGKSRKESKIAALNKFLKIYYARVMELYI